jgi:hypothetical protein
MLERTISRLQAQRLSDFLAFYFPRQRDWYLAAWDDPLGPVLGTRKRVYKRDDDLADEIITEPEFRPVLESFYLRQPANAALQRAIAEQAPELTFELSELMIAALRITAKRVKQDAGILPWTRRLAVGLLVWRLAPTSGR